MSAASAFPVVIEPASTVMLGLRRRRIAQLPWWLKIILKMILSRLPLPYRLWRRIGVFRLGCLADDREGRDPAGERHSARR